jgi:hypothetical protein
MYVQTIEKVNFKPTDFEKGGKVKETERLRPKIIGRKIIYPGIYQDQFGCHDMCTGTQWIQVAFRLT